MARTYRVAQFAKLAGVTVRTLQYYDRIDLLKPSDVTDAGYRLYTTPDLRRLQQILTLKWMGFSLQEIKEVLASERYNLRASLTIQKEAIDAQIERLRAASDALGQAIDAAEQTGDEALDAQTVGAILRGVTGSNHDQWVRRYYSDDAWAGIQTRRLAYAPEEMERVQQEWQTLMAEFAKLRHEAPESPAVQRLAARMDALLGLFTGGDRAAEDGLQALYADTEQVTALHAAHGIPLDMELQRFMQAAYTHYREQPVERRKEKSR